MNAPNQTQELFFRIEKLNRRGQWNPISGARHDTARSAANACDWYQRMTSPRANLRISEVTITVTPL